MLAGQIARALAVFCVDEVVIFDDGVQDSSSMPERRRLNSGEKTTPANDLLALILSYLETPPHMRRVLFPMNPDLQKAGLLPSLDMPHHLRRDEWCQYREGVTVGGHTGPGPTTVDVGSEIYPEVAVDIPANTRVTIKYASSEPGSVISQAQAVAPTAPREEEGWYWGYDVRQASSLSSVFTECTWEEGYDVSIGTSERGRPVHEVLKLWSHSKTENEKDSQKNGVANDIEKIKALQKYKHLLIVFGGHQGLEIATKNDPELGKMKVGQPEQLFDWWVNLCPGQGSRTIRTEEAVWLGLTMFRFVVEERGR